MKLNPKDKQILKQLGNDLATAALGFVISLASAIGLVGLLGACFSETFQHLFTAINWKGEAWQFGLVLWVVAFFFRQPPKGK